ncbi:DNA polymerase beta subunit [Candidatus Magnetomorum sp. HK-1]|nr:DNA polymerase beta subunit [Candidatus Magnetomorum sp. HK-1]
MNISQKNLATYRETARKKENAAKEQIQYRYKKAWKTAYNLSKILKEEFHVTETFVFGSLGYLRPELFHMHSDIDIAVRGLDHKKYYSAVARLMDCDFEVDLIMMDFASNKLRQRIEKEGILL